jgi:hypothetical protein
LWIAGQILDRIAPLSNSLPRGARELTTEYFSTAVEKYFIP